MVTSVVDSNLLSRVDSTRSAPRIASPAVIIGLGSTGCQITQNLENTTSSWSATDRKSLGYLYLVLSQLGFGNCLRKRLRLLPFFRSVDVGGWQPWDENGMWSGWKGKNETSWND